MAGGAARGFWKTPVKTSMTRANDPQARAISQRPAFPAIWRISTPYLEILLRLDVASQRISRDE
jgi:hypothetical protein